MPRNDVIEQALPAILDDEARQRTRLAAQLKPRLLEMVGIEMAVAAGPHEHAGLEPAFARQHVGQQRIGGDVERNAEEDVGAALVKLEGEAARGDLRLEQAVAGGERHLREFARIPCGDDLPTRMRIAADQVDDRIY